jgi:hypothetical protein
MVRISWKRDNGRTITAKLSRHFLKKGENLRFLNTGGRSFPHILLLYAGLGGDVSPAGVDERRRKWL